MITYIRMYYVYGTYTYDTYIYVYDIDFYWRR